ncbi:unnamed protein product [Heligmosomoides polygyrus]|uniref:EGF-like domain-containing protein n=1 Tax=Heligmosomoides polygyrus TaxID=6339 RepID=A0A3P8E7E4_HELPZ|nr:unnamed protein product [Heligmosomoides polygyrus]
MLHRRSTLPVGIAARCEYLEGPPCESWPCWNEGRCVPNGTRGYSCICRAHFAGRQCQYKVRSLSTDSIFVRIRWARLYCRSPQPKSLAGLVLSFER